MCSVRIATESDIPELNRIANHSSVFPYIQAPGVMLEGPVDFTGSFSQFRFYLAEGGFFMLHPMKFWPPETLEVHTCFMEGYRGANALRIAREAVTHAFTETLATKIVTKVALDNKMARVFTAWLGFASLGSDDRFSYHELTWMNWLMNAKGLDYLGECFNEALPDRVRVLELTQLQARCFGFLANILNCHNVIARTKLELFNEASRFLMHNMTIQILDDPDTELNEKLIEFSSPVWGTVLALCDGEKMIEVVPSEETGRRSFTVES